MSICGILAGNDAIVTAFVLYLLPITQLSGISPFVYFQGVAFRTMWEKAA